MNKKRIIGLSAAILLVICAGLVFWFVSDSKNNDKETTSAEITLKITAVFHDGTEKDYEFKTTATLLSDALVGEGLVSADDMKDGFINAFDSKTASAENEEWWKISQNSEMLMKGATETKINDGDTFEIVLTKGYS